MPPKVNKGGNTIQTHLRPVTHEAATSCSEPISPPGTSDTQPKLTDVASLKTELLSTLREDVTAIFRSELHAALGENLSSIKTELLAMKSELSSSICAVQQNFVGLKSTVTEMEQSLSTCTDDILSLQTKVGYLTKEMGKLEDRCEDLESRSRRQNIRIIGVPEDDSAATSTAGVSKLLKEAFALGKEPLVERAHRVLMPKPKPGDRPRAIVAKLHYDMDCAGILRKARELQRIKVRNMTISVFPDYTPKTARARAAFSEVRRLLNITFSERPPFLSPWRFNPILLSDDTFSAFIVASIDDFITINKNDTVSYSLLWESLKAYLRGQIISYSAHRNRTHKARLNELLSKIMDIDRQNAINPCQSLAKQ
uniref:L1 transposable element RRM domain-containing protein n=1 Tax=Stegastes partitus TaxID=144197 RepID=A0A3B5ARW6_9TELE